MADDPARRPVADDPRDPRHGARTRRQPIRDVAANGEDAGALQFVGQWAKMADKPIRLADEDKTRGCAFSVATKLERVALYLLSAERMQGHAFRRQVHWSSVRLRTPTGT